MEMVGYDPCIKNCVEKYYNWSDMQKALHSNVIGTPYKWTTCSDVFINNQKDSKELLPTYKELIETGFKIWVFSGDTDSVVPMVATRFSLGHFNLPIKTPWFEIQYRLRCVADVPSHNPNFKGKMWVVTTTQMVGLRSIDQEISKDELLQNLMHNLLHNLDSNGGYELKRSTLQYKVLFWEGMKVDIRRYVVEYETCQ